MKIYTKTGDRGETGLLGGKRVAKDHDCVEVCGTLDELNSILGVVLACDCSGPVEEVLRLVQIELFNIGGSVAAAHSRSIATSELSPENIELLETRMDQLEKELEPLTAFIMPGGGQLGSHLHWARTVCRRCERRLVSLVGQDMDRDFSQVLVFLNRLGDYLFVAARFENARAGIGETRWLPKK